MPAVTMTNAETLINEFLYLVPVTLSPPDRRAYLTVHFKTCWCVYAEAVIQFTASNSEMYNLQTELRSRVINSLLIDGWIGRFLFPAVAFCVALNKMM